MNRLTTMLLAAVLAAAAPRPAPGWTEPGNAPPLVTLSVVDDETGDPVERFRVLPGTPYRRDGQPPVAAWQPHLIGESASGRFEWRRERSYEMFRLRIEAEGYRPSMTEWIRKAEGPRELTVRLRRDPGLHGVVLLPDGTPAAGATLGIALPNRGLSLDGAAIEGAGAPPAERLSDRWRQPVAVKADAGGRFRLPPESDPSALLIVVHEGGYSELTLVPPLGTASDPKAFATLWLSPWGRIAGTYFWVDEPCAGELVELIVTRETTYPAMAGSYQSIKSDVGGRFEFRNVPPGRAQLAGLGPAPKGDEDLRYQFPVTHVDVRAGGVTEVRLGGRAQAVAGVLTGLDSYKGVTLRVGPDAPHIGRPGDDERWRAYRALANSPRGAAIFRNAILVNEDGAFLIEGLVPGHYQLMVDSADRRVRGGTSLTLKPSAGNDDGFRELVEIRVTRAAP